MSHQIEALERQYSFGSTTNTSTAANNKTDVKELKAWLTKSNCQHLLLRFLDNGITMDLLPELDTNSLKELGIERLGDRLRLEIAIATLKTERLKHYIDVNELYRKLNLELTVSASGSAVGGNANGIGGNGSSRGVDSPGDGTLIQSATPKRNASFSSTSLNDSSKNITFILQDGSLKKVNVTGCFNAQAIKKKVLKKLGFKKEDAQFDTYIHSTHNIEYRNIYANFEPAVVMLYDVELVTICYSPDRMEKHRLILVPRNESPTQTAIDTSLAIMRKYDKLAISGTGAGVSGAAAGATVGSTSADQLRIGTPNSEAPAATMAQHKPNVQRRNLRNFFGQRPPSELISSNLAEYFPDTRQRDLEQTVKNSVRHSVRLSRRFNLPPGAFTSGAGGLPLSRFSMMSGSTGAASQRALSISSGGNASSGIGIDPIRRGQRTVGDVMMSNVNAIDEAVNSLDTMSIFSKPSSVGHNHITSDVPSSSSSPRLGLQLQLNGPRGLGGVSALPPVANVAASSTPAAALAFDAKSFVSNKSIGSGTTLRRISILASNSDNQAANNRHSTIELLEASDSEDEEDDYDAYYNGLGDVSQAFSVESDNNVPDNWLKGAKIGSGSFGTVYLGMNPYTGELMAVKQIPLHPAAEAGASAGTTPNNVDGSPRSPNKPGRYTKQIAFQNDPLQKKVMEEQEREMMLLKELNHENIVRYFGSKTDDKYLNIFLEYVPGGSVQTMLNSYGPFEEPLIRNFIRQVLIGLSYLHGEDIIHRDIKGANILIDIKGTVKIGDFGISKKVSTIDEEDEDFKRTGKRASLQGSVFWMAPEVVKQTTYTKKADIWSVGCLIVEMFTGKHPFPNLSQMQALFKIGNHVSPESPEWCTIEAKRFLEKTFELHYDRRPDAIELLADPFLNALIMSKQ
ncbi:hypothetical protein LELG_01263 [Lodderomyces elongisporus NRRL YB-4239]|uniref:mitogen-activated protein kinase kinase kinase n=1 Tax=Lodderomyces elongisporus (strain ATCC 11503 / CBS 2605 / JCM 1781 / NBRC 1676 / NRRL YB-4239) TaxID=379508 RepID=A5DV77_LODEL|nr:hypothetical protein LELG_01263 [Lodderomyces elongisporus NRRL YB-4239]